MACITLISVSSPAIVESCRYAESVKDRGIIFKVHCLAQGCNPDISTVTADIAGSDAILVDLMGVRQDWYNQIVQCVKKTKCHRIILGSLGNQLGRLGGYDAARMKMDAVDENILHRFGQCWKRAEPQDIQYIFDTLIGRYLNMEGFDEIETDTFREGLYIKDPLSGKEYDSQSDYEIDHPRRFGTKTALMFIGNNYPARTISCVRSFYSALSEFTDVIPIAANSYNIRDMGKARALLEGADAIVNLMPFRFIAGPMGGDSASAVELLRSLDAPLLSPFYMTSSTEEEWMASKKGLDPMEFSLSVFLPELDGALCTLPVGFRHDLGELNEFGISVKEIQPLDDRVNRICGKVRRYLALREKPNSEKKIAILAYNDPPGEGSLFGGSFLDGAGSLESILKTLYDAGYDTTPLSAEDILDRFIGSGMTNGGDWTTPSNETISIPATDKHDPLVEKTWGKAPGEILVRNGRYLIPGIILGKIFIGLQSPRSAGQDDLVQNYHDDSIPPHHQYLALYDWIANGFEADALVHLGTHGTLEFLPGKEVAMSGTCYPDRMVGDLPHIYIYYSGNTSEAMIAKRRTHAGLISYMPPVFVKSGTYGDMVELEEAIAEYREAMRSDPGRAESIHAGLVEKAKKMRLPEDLEELEDEIIAIRESLIPYGLHKFGKAYTPEEAETFAIHSMRFPHDGIQQLNVHLGLTERETEELISEYNSKGTIKEQYRSDIETGNALRFEKRILDASTITDESISLVRALDGKFIEAKVGGDILKTPEMLPTGYNIIQFNPDRIPSASAFARGKDAVDNMLRDYMARNGSWPDSVALVLWGLETSRTQGMTIGEISHFLGLRMVRNSGPFASRFEPIPLEDLGRPRIDVVVSMCGFFRDMFPGVVSGLDDLFRLVGNLDEPDEMNHIRRANARNREFLSGKGIAAEELEELSQCRLFGPSEDNYGSGVNDLVQRSEWEEESELADCFSTSMRYAYTRNLRGYDAGELVRFNHASVDMVSQVRDSTDREIIDLDHYYEFLGGLSKSVEVSKGRRAALFVVDGSGPAVRTMDAKTSIERGIHSRLLNPKWIDGLLKVKYHGTQQINDRFENMLGLAATTGTVESSVFSDMETAYIHDPLMRERLRENNNWAFMSMINRLFEANRRGYWDATEEELEELKKAFIESEEQAEMDSDN